MYFSDLGTLALILATGFTLYAAIAAVLGGMRAQPRLVESARRSVLVVALFLLLAAAMLLTSFLVHDFGVEYVAHHSSRSMPWYFVSSAFYAGQQGSLLYWAVAHCLFAALFVLTSRRVPAALVPYIIATLMAIALFFLLVLVTISNPFVRTASIPVDGQGLNPVLMDPGMLVHPPLLLTGYMSFAVPFAFAIAAMITGRLSSEWLRGLRRWMLAAWTIQTAGLLLGSWWAYHVLGWGGYWGWDPVENAALFPWLTATAFLHSAMVQERRGMLKVWNLCLVIASFAFAVFGTFAVRSGVVSSVHSFAYSEIGGVFLAFLVVVIIFPSVLFLLRLPRLRPEQEFDSVVSREGVFLLNNLVLVGLAFATLWGTLFPVISAVFQGQAMTVGPPFYNQVAGPLLVVLVLLMGIGPLLAWRRTSLNALWRNLSIPAILAAICALILPVLGITNVMANIGFTVCAFTAAAILYELWRGMRVRHKHGEPYPVALYMLFKRYRQRYGGYVVHLGLVLLVVGIIGSHFFQLERDAVLRVGQDVQIADYRLTYLGNVLTEGGDHRRVEAQVQIWQGDRLMQYIYPGQVVYNSYPDQPVSAISISTVGVVDLYVFMPRANGLDEASLRVFLNPLVPFVWYGGVCMLLGGIICWWPERRKSSTRSKKVIAKQEREPASKDEQAEEAVL